MALRRGGWHTVQQGETMIGLARAYGVFDWRTIWSHAQNASLRRQRANPQILGPGDRVFIPPPAPVEYEVAIDQKHTFRLKKRRESFVTFALKDEAGAALANHRYELTLGDTVLSGTTGADGLVAHPAPPDVTEGTIKVWVDADDPDQTVSWPVRVGHLDPIDTVSGVQARLNNLGFSAGEVNGLLGESTQEALQLFQRANGLEPTGAIDDATRDALQGAHNEKLG
jgi:N-acetylmuramoyl-L-alanine amidase